MNEKRRVREVLKRLVFGPPNLPQQCPIGLRDPQSEIAVHLCGLGEPIDVTHRHMMACGFPFTIGIGCDEDLAGRCQSSKLLRLAFREKYGRRRLLGNIGLRASAELAAGSKKLCLFQPRGYSNHCLPKPWLWSRYLYYAGHRSSPQTAEMPLTPREVHSMCVFYICPRPVALVSIGEGATGNIFPMNLMGAVDWDCFSFALNGSRPVTAAVERTGRLAVSSIPLDRAATATDLGKNHRSKCVPLSELPFATKRSTLLGLHVPAFALRVREMQIESVREIGSHKLFVARVLRDERISAGMEFFVVHGIYQTYRLRSGIVSGSCASVSRSVIA